MLGSEREAGVSLIELVVGLLIGVLLLAIASPTYQEYQRSRHLESVAAQLAASIQLARAEAARRQKFVSMCPTDNASDHSPKCAEHSNYFSWLVFEDGDGACLPIAGESPIQVVAVLKPEEANRISLRGNGSCISFTPTGAVRKVLDVRNADRFLACDIRGIGMPTSSDPSSARGIMLDPQGRVTQTRQRQVLLAWRLPCTPWSH